VLKETHRLLRGLESMSEESNSAIRSSEASTVDVDSVSAYPQLDTGECQ
jgi:hypothetical protein